MLKCLRAINCTRNYHGTVNLYFFIGFKFKIKINNLIFFLLSDFLIS